MVLSGVTRSFYVFYRALGFRVGVGGVASPLIWVVSIVMLLLSPHTTTHEPPSRVMPYPSFRAPRFLHNGS